MQYSRVYARLRMNWQCISYNIIRSCVCMHCILAAYTFAQQYEQICVYWRCAISRIFLYSVHCRCQAFGYHLTQQFDIQPSLCLESCSLVCGTQPFILIDLWLFLLAEDVCPFGCCVLSYPIHTTPFCYAHIRLAPCARRTWLPVRHRRNLSHLLSVFLPHTLYSFFSSGAASLADQIDTASCPQLWRITIGKEKTKKQKQKRKQKTNSRTWACGARKIMETRDTASNRRMTVRLKIKELYEFVCVRVRSRCHGQHAMLRRPRSALLLLLLACVLRCCVLLDTQYRHCQAAPACQVDSCVEFSWKISTTIRV